MTHWDADDDAKEVPLYMRTQAFKHGSDLISMGVFDLEGLKMRCPVSIEVRGYAKQQDIP